MKLTRRSLTLGLAAAGTVPHIPLASAQTPMKLTLAHNIQPSSPKGMGATEIRGTRRGENPRTHQHPRCPFRAARQREHQHGRAAYRNPRLRQPRAGCTALVVPEVAVLGMPFLFANLPDAWAALDGPIGQRLAKALETKNVVFLAWWCNGIRQTTNNKHPITKPEDFKGLKIRTPLDTATVDMFSAMGATPQQISWGEVYLALQSGVVDGQENPLANIYSGKLFKMQNFITFTNHKYEATCLLVSAATWKRLSETDRKLVQEAAAETTVYQRKTMADAEGESARRVQKDVKYPDEQRRYRHLSASLPRLSGISGKRSLSAISSKNYVLPANSTPNIPDGPHVSNWDRYCSLDGSLGNTPHVLGSAIAGRDAGVRSRS